RFPPVLEARGCLAAGASRELVIAERGKHRDLLLRPLEGLALVGRVVVRIGALVNEVPADQDRGRVLARDPPDECAPRGRVHDLLAPAEARVAVDDEGEGAPVTGAATSNRGGSSPDAAPALPCVASSNMPKNKETSLDAARSIARPSGPSAHLKSTSKIARQALRVRGPRACASPRRAQGGPMTGRRVRENSKLGQLLGRRHSAHPPPIRTSVSLAFRPRSCAP